MIVPCEYEKVADTAQKLAVSRNKVKKLMDDGELEGVRLGKLIRIRIASVDKLLKRSEVGAQ